ncbi:uncharacterized protein BP01DRAFT_383321 [Aspergillus saccharolyticus JOP 1030-1]|uniref:Heterokaryon incompatibility domain-containing protein n=1 Tax=Aspergillus saccharolyticus JOP 1030-1 TaxID=1450539 RepID=A0A318ZDT5_9EURO|nr:hypothetical protein BP01DRAFT_383321 [Aspergillus saccharolyticus JOP 1030-1]PYH44757.1 hypothetical protein BP01DRAFT_383321 [Aspergillus saccharolyticus JOP 1030-1]
MLCSYCNQVFHSSAWNGPHHPNTASLTLAAHNGCYICQSILHDLTQNDSSPDGNWSYRIYNDAGYSQLIIDNESGKPQPHDTTPYCYTLLAVPSETLSFNPGPRMRDSSARLADTITAVEGWLKVCLREHACPRNLQPEYHPSQLLKISREGNVRLMILDKNRFKAPYAVLHCGLSDHAGKDWLLVVETLRSGARISDLPAALSEVFTLLQAVGINHIWLPQVCNLSVEQPYSPMKKEDMCLYSNAILTIALSIPGDAKHSVFNHSMASQNQMLPFQVTPISGVMGQIVIGSGKIDEPRNNSLSCTFIPWSYLPDTLHHNGNHSGGIQSRLATPRFLTIDSEAAEIFWECSCFNPASESLPAGIIPYLPSSLLTGPDRFPHRDTIVPSDAGWYTLLGFWYRILDEYTATVSASGERIGAREKLVGVEWLADEVARRMRSADDVSAQSKDDSEYLAGHFWGSMPLSLGWRVGDSVNDDDAEKDGCVPSWSWASIRGGKMHSPVAWGDETDQRCLAQRVEYSKGTEEDWIVQLTLRTFVVKTQFSSCDGNAMEVAGLKGDRYWVEVEWDPEVEDLEELWLAVIVEDSWLRQWSGLVLREAVGDKESFRRVGYFMLNTVQEENCMEEWKENFRMAAGGEMKAIILV